MSGDWAIIETTQLIAAVFEGTLQKSMLFKNKDRISYLHRPNLAKVEAS